MATATNGAANELDDFGASSDGESMMRDYDDESDASFDKRKKRCYKHRVLPPTEICTRGGDRPRFTFERLTHQKILLASPRKERKHRRVDVTEVGFTSKYVTPLKGHLISLKENMWHFFRPLVIPEYVVHNVRKFDGALISL